MRYMTFIPNQEMFRKNTLDLERAGTWHDASSLTTYTRKFQSCVESFHKQNGWEGVLASVVHFDTQKREFPLLLNIPLPPYSMKQNNLLPVQSLKRFKKATFPTLLTMIVAIFCRWKRLWTLFSKRKNNAQGLFLSNFVPPLRPC